MNLAYMKWQAARRFSHRPEGYVLDRALLSDDYSAGVSGWLASREGDFEINNLVARGTIYSTAGSIGGFDLGSDYIRDSANSFGLASTVSGGDDVRFWAGATFANRSTAPFRLTEAGALTATAGSIGGFTIGSINLTAGTGTSAIELTSDVSGKDNNAALLLGTTGGKRSTYANHGAFFYSATQCNIILGVGQGFTDNCGSLELLTDASASPQIVLRADTAEIYSNGTVRANTAFNHNGTAGATGSFDPAAVTSIVVAGGIITGWS